MTIDLGGILSAGLTVAGILVAFAIPVIVIVGLFWLAHRRFSGRRGRFDGLFTGLGRANAVNSHLHAGTPEPDDLAVPLPRVRPRRRRFRRVAADVEGRGPR